jgi:hypothetical protein
MAAWDNTGKLTHSAIAACPFLPRVARVSCWFPRARVSSGRAEVYSEFSNKDLKNVGNYSLGRLIGKGSFGKVYLAHHKLVHNSKVRRSSPQYMCPGARFPDSKTRSFSSQLRKKTRISLERSTTTGSSSTLISHDSTRS